MKHAGYSYTIRVIALLWIAAGILLTSTVYAQQETPGAPPQERNAAQVKEDYTKDELKTFIEVNQKITEVQQQMEKKMMQAISDGGMEVNKFNEILTAKQNPEAEVQASEEELAQFDAISQEIISVQQGMQQELVKAVEEAGMDVAVYDQMMYAYQNSEKVQQEVNKMLEEKPDGK